MNTSTTTVKAPIEIAPPARKIRLANPGWFLVSPSVALLLLWMIVPLGMTVYFSMIRYNLLYPGENEFVGLENFTYFLTDSGFMPGATNTLLLVGSVLLISMLWVGALLVSAIALPPGSHDQNPVETSANGTRAATRAGCPGSGKLIHSIHTRQLTCSKPTLSTTTR